MRKSVLIGLDPGGKEHFGWAVLAGGDLPLRLRASGVESSARDAVLAARKACTAKIAAAAIDSPLFWSFAPDRTADRLLRDTLKKRGFASGSVLAVNSLQGACLAQGMLAAADLRRSLPRLPISESHPKALLPLLGVALVRRELTLHPLSDWIAIPPGLDPSEHERDAAVGALSAWAMVTRAHGWQDLAALEANTFRPIAEPLGYWMPMDVDGAGRPDAPTASEP